MSITSQLQEEGKHLQIVSHGPKEEKNWESTRLLGVCIQQMCSKWAKYTKKRTLIHNRISPFFLIYLEQRQKHSAVEKGVKAPHMKRPLQSLLKHYILHF